MDSIQWTYQPTAEEIKKSELVSRMLATAFHLSGLIYYLVYYFSENKNKVFAITLAVIYIVGLFIWHLFLKKTFILITESFSLSDSGITITNVENNKTTYYKWEDLNSFSDNIMVYFDKGTAKVNMPSISPAKYLYIGTPKNSFDILKVSENQITKVYELLRSRLIEKNV